MTPYTYASITCNMLGLATVASALLVVVMGNKNPVNSVLWLIMSFVSAACYLITAGMTFMGLSYVIVYVGAIAVLFLFVVMMLNIAGTDASLSTTTAPVSVDHRKAWPIALLIVFMSLVTVLPLSLQANFDHTIPMSLMNGLNQTIIMWGSQASSVTEAISATSGLDWTGMTSNPPMVGNGSLIDTPNQVQVLGMTLYTHGAVWLLLVSFLLMLAMIVPLALAFT